MVELLAVLVLIGVGLSVAAPKFSGMLRSQRADAVGALLATDISLARVSAIRSGRPAAVIISSATEYRVELQTEPVRVLKQVRVSNDHPGFTIAGDPATITFSSRGILTGGAATITVTGALNTTVVTVTPVGRVYRDSRENTP